MGDTYLSTVCLFPPQHGRLTPADLESEELRVFWIMMSFVCAGLPNDVSMFYSEAGRVECSDTLK